MQVLWQKTTGMDKRVGFYLTDEGVLFEYSGPFDRNTGEWINVRGCFSSSEFARCVETLSAKPKAEMKGLRDESLTMEVLPQGMIALTFMGGYTNNIAISDLGVTPSELKASLAVLPKHQS